MKNDFELHPRMPAMILEARQMLQEQFQSLPPNHWYWKETEAGREDLLARLAYDVAQRTLAEGDINDAN
ncbi:hypothetical protein NIES4106_61280 (plasmid) [Fischerella sp. NIES-4106]|nr:hypothetical protein NIES4106_61280 [Fischerella sp. NIES-4106]